MTHPKIPAESVRQPGLLNAAFRKRITEQTVAIDVGASNTKAEISRGGFSIAEIPLSPELVGSFLDARPVVATKVVTQSIAPGTAVAAGTAIDLTITSTADLPIKVVPGTHKALAQMTMAQVYERFATDPQMRDILRARSTAEELTSDDVAVLTTVLKNNKVPLSNAPGETVASAFTAIQAAYTFQS